MPAKKYDWVPLPPTIRALLQHNTHPGLELDKYAATWPSNAAVKWQEAVQKPTAEQVSHLSQSPPRDFDWVALRGRRTASLTAMAADFFTCTTVGPLTLHLSRASALENAGICLHSLYGFAYLPGSGLKGMARAYAETVWLASQSDKSQAWRMIEDVFGWAPGSDKGKDWKPDGIPDRTKGDNTHVGNIVFHDAWPTEWPRMIVDIVNNHHPDYYSAGPTDNDRPPGDWENPNPVYFLAVPTETAFQFALSLRRSDGRKEWLQQAKEWLVGALCHLGAGAKTAAGYGSFRCLPIPPPHLPPSVRATFEATLELVTPAFLAGANQQKEDCDLRSATLRGLLRWWWRTMHAGYVDVPTLRRLETAVWGDTESGSPLRLTIEQIGEITKLPYDKQLIKQRNLPDPRVRQTGRGPKPCTQGLWYHSYGMDEQKGRRWFIVPGAKWRITFTARPSCYIEQDARGKVLRKETIEDPELILSQASAALWLLCHFGGVGAKARRGFGCFQDLTGMTLEDCKEATAALRGTCKVSGPFREAYAQSPALEQLLSPDGSKVFWLEIEASSPWPNYWALLNIIGDAAQQFAEGYAHQVEKKTLGLPRNVRGQGVFRPGRHVEGRHSAPAWYHVGRSTKGYIIRVAVLPARELPDLNTSREFHTKLLEHLKHQLPRMLQQQHSHGQKPISNPGTPRASSEAVPATQPARALKSGDRIEGVIVEDPKKKNRLFALYEHSRLQGPVLNANEVPPEKKQIGARIPLVVQSISSDGKQVQFRYSVAPEPKASASGGPARSPSGKPPRKGDTR